LHFGWCQLFIVNLGLEERGAAAATNLTFILNMVIADALVRYLQTTEFDGMVFWYDKTVF